MRGEIAVARASLEMRKSGEGANFLRRILKMAGVFPLAIGNCGNGRGFCGAERQKLGNGRRFCVIWKLIETRGPESAEKRGI
jgi:hypothetical protein